MLYVNYILIKLGFEQMGSGVRIQCRWKVQQLQRRLGQADGDWGPQGQYSPLCKAHTFQYQLPILTLLMALWNYSYVESQFSQYHWIQLYLSLIFRSWPVCQVYFRSQGRILYPAINTGGSRFFTAWPIIPLSLNPTLLESPALAQLGKMTAGARTPLPPSRPRNCFKIEYWTVIAQ